MAIDHFGEFLIGFEPLPLDRIAPVLEEATRPSVALIVPQLSKRFSEYIRGVQPLVGSPQSFECLTAFQAQILPVGKQRVRLPLDKTPVLAGEARVFAASHYVQSLTQVARVNLPF